MAGEKIRVLQAVYCLGRGGAERLAIDITNELNSRQDVEALLVSFDKTVAYEYSVEGVKYKFCPASVNLSFLRPATANLENYKRIVGDFKPHIIHSHRYLTEVITREEPEPNVAYFTHCHDNIVQFQNLSLHTVTNKSKLTNYYEKLRLMKKYKACNNQFITISPDTENYMRSVLPHPLNTHTHLLPNCIDFKRFNKANHLRDTDTIRIINIGSFTTNKNQVLLVELLRALKQKNIPASVTFVGDGSELAQVKAAVNRYGLHAQVEFTGNVTNVEDYLQKANLYVHTSRSESFGLVSIEAMAAGLPVIALDAGGNRELIQNGTNGYLIPTEDPALFIEKMEAIMNNSSTYHQMSKHAVAFAAKFDTKEYGDRLVALYRQHIK